MFREKEEQERAAAEAQNARVETQRLQEEKSSDTDMQAWRQGLLEARERTMQEVVKWRAYMLCKPLPDVAHQNELTAYLTLWRDEVIDDPLSDKAALSVGEVVDKCHAGELVNSMVQSVIGELSCPRSLSVGCPHVELEQWSAPLPLDSPT